jgi:hypothetical protein
VLHLWSGPARSQKRALIGSEAGSDPVDSSSSYARPARGGVGKLARVALIDNSLHVGAIVSVVFWTALFAAGAVWRPGRDTARV